MCILLYLSFIRLHVYAFAINSMVHCGRAFEPNAYNKWESRGRHLWQSGGRDMESRHSWRQEICREGPTDQMSKTCQGGPNCIVMSVHVGRAAGGGAPEPPRATGVRPEFLGFCPFSGWLNLGGFLFSLLFFTFFEIGIHWSPIVGWTDVKPPSMFIVRSQIFQKNHVGHVRFQKNSRKRDQKVELRSVGTVFRLLWRAAAAGLKPLRLPHALRGFLP